MRKFITAIVLTIALALALTISVSAEQVTFSPDAKGLYNIDYALNNVISGTVEDGTMFGMVAIEATGSVEEFVLDESTIRYIDQTAANAGKIKFDAFAPMDRADAENGKYLVYIGGEGLDAATQIGVLSTEAEPTEPELVLGDINGDGNVDIQDATELFNHSMMPDFFPISYTGNIDYEKDGKIDIQDATYLFNYSMMPDFFPID